jgi:hypothetical protein
MKSVFRKMLPTDVEQAGQGAINTWVEAQIKAFYAGNKPGEINWDALIAEYDRLISEKLGKQKLLDTLMQKLIESGRTPDKYAAQQALGMTSPLKQMFLGGVAPEQVGQDLQLTMEQALQGVTFTTDMTKPPTDSFAVVVATSMGKSFDDQGWAGKLIASFDADVTNRVADVKKIGARVGGYIFEGMRDELKNYSIIDTIAAVVIDELTQATKGPKGGPPQS